MKHNAAFSALLVFTFFTTMLSAQIENPTAGYIINTTGDTLNGILNLDNEVLLSKGVYWQENAGSEQIRYYEVYELKEFGFTESGRIYRPIVHTYVRDDDTLKLSDTRMARILYDGPLKLFRVGVPAEEFYKVLEDIPPWAYYILTEDGEYIKLEVTEKQLSSTMGYPYAKYRGPLKYLMRDWPQAPEQIDNTNFKDDELVQLVREYIAYKHPEAIGTQFEQRKVVAYSHFLNLTYGGWSGDFANDDLLTSVIGVGYMLKSYNPYFDNSFEMAVGLEYLMLNYQENQMNRTLRVDEGWTIRLPVQAEFYLTNKWKNVQPRVFGTLILGYLNRKGENLQTETVIVNGVSEEVPIGYFPFMHKDVSVRFSAGLGVDIYNRARLGIKYEKQLGFLLNAAWKLN